MIHEVYILPWASTKDVINIGEFVLWPWTNRYRRDRLLPSDELARRTAVRAVHSFKNRNGHPVVDSATILSRTSGDTSPFSEAETERARIVVTIVAYSYFIENSALLARTAENFSLYQRRIDTGPAHQEDWPVTRYISGSIVRREEIVRDSDRVSFLPPRYVNFPLARTTPNERTLKMLTKLYEGWNGTELAKRAWVALDSIFWAYSNVETLRERQRVVQLATAFEALLTSRSDSQKARKLAEFVDRNVSLRRGKYKRKTMHGRPCATPDRHTRYGWWVRELYDLRNTIVHGGSVDSVDLSYGVRRTGEVERTSRFLLGLKFFDECLYENLVLRGVMRGNVEERIVRNILRAGLLGDS